MKKIIAALLALLLACPWAFALADSWWRCPVCGSLNNSNFCPTDGTPRNSGGSAVVYHPAYTNFGYASATLNRKLASRTGPGTVYDEGGTFLSSGQRVVALTRAYDERNEIWWVQVRFTVRGTSYQLYTGAKRFDNLRLADLPTESVIGSCYVGRTLPGYYGPGPEYALIGKDVPAGVFCDVYACAPGQDGDYIQIEFYDFAQQRTRRAWVRYSQVSDYVSHSSWN